MYSRLFARTSYSWLLAIFVFGASVAVKAAPVPPPGFDSDTGASYFTPSDELLGFELFDLLEPVATFGFFFESDPGTLITLFDGTDPNTGPGSQITYFNFTNGQVWDVDSVATAPESIFTPAPDKIGFFLTLGPTTLYSDASLNSGLDVFSAFEKMGEPGSSMLIFEGIFEDGSLSPINLTLVKGISAVPVPAAVWLFGSGLIGLVGIARRQRKIN